jgi:hypothetical protein
MLQAYERLGVKAERSDKEFDAMISDNGLFIDFARKLRTALKRQSPALTFLEVIQMIRKDGWKAQQHSPPAFRIPYSVQVHSDHKQLYQVTTRAAGESIVRQQRMRR